MLFSYCLAPLVSGAGVDSSSIMLKNCSKHPDPRRDTARTFSRWWSLRARQASCRGQTTRKAWAFFLPPTTLFNYIAAHSYWFASEGTYLEVGPESRPISRCSLKCISAFYPLSCERYGVGTGEENQLSEKRKGLAE